MPYKRGKKWMGQVRVNGKKHRKSFDTKAQATEWEVNYKESDACPNSSPRIDIISLLEWATKYLDYAKVKFSKKTYLEKQYVFKLLFQQLDPEYPVTMLSPGQVLSFLQKQTEKRSGNAANKDRKNLVAAWNWGTKYLGLPAMNPCLVDRFPEQRKVRYVPREKDFWIAFDVCKTEQDKVLLLGYLHLAARRNELFTLRWQDVDFAESRVRLFTRKRRDGSLEFDWLPMTDDLYAALLTHRQSAKNEWVFPDPETGLPYLFRQRWMSRLCAKAKVKPFCLHAIRHLTASILAKANVPMIDIQAILRHKNLATTERYIRRLSTLRPALKVLPGRKSPQLAHNEEMTETNKKRETALSS